MRFSYPSFLGYGISVRRNSGQLAVALYIFCIVLFLGRSMPNVAEDRVSARLKIFLSFVRISPILVSLVARAVERFVPVRVIQRVNFLPC